MLAAMHDPMVTARKALSLLGAAAPILFVAAAVAADAPVAPPASPVPGTVGSAMPKIELKTVGGAPLSLDTLAGRVVLYEFWATWCTPCHVQVEILKELYPRSLAAGVEFVGVATGEPEELVAGHLASHPTPYPELVDPDERLGTAIEVVALPTLVVVDREGRIAWRSTGLTDRSTLEDAFAAAGAKPPPVDVKPATLSAPAGRP